MADGKIHPTDHKVDVANSGDAGDVSYFSFKDVFASIKVKGSEKQLLQNISGYCKPGEALALMGPSGAGKSTLLDVLAFRKTLGHWGGDIRMNGFPVNKAQAVARSGYVTCDDVEVPHLTVKETLQFAAGLKLPKLNAAQREARIVQVMEDMHLTSRANNLVGSILVRGLSTGERKRLSIAIELLSATSVLFLDEPTTGLDSSTGLEIVTRIMEICRERQLAVIMTIHQPSYQILEQFNRLMLLAHGKLCYFGPTPDAIKYFEGLGITLEGNPAETYAEVLAERHEELTVKYTTSELNRENLEKVDSIHNQQGSVTLYASNAAPPSFWQKIGIWQNAPWWKQFVYLAYREGLTYLRNPMMTTARFIGAIAVALFFGGAFFQTGDSAAASQAKSVITFGLSLVPGLFNVAAIPYWLSGRKLFYLQTSGGFYHPFMWMLTQYVIECLFLGSMMACMVAIAYSMSGFKSAELGFYVGLVLIESFGYTGYCLMITMLSATTEYAMTGFNLIFFYNTIFGGFFVVDSHLHKNEAALKFFQWLSVQRGFYIATLRKELYEMPVNCLQGELLPYPLGNLTKAAMSAAFNTYAAQAIVNSPTLQSLNTTNPSAFTTTISGLGNVAGVLGNAGLASANIARIRTNIPSLSTFPANGLATFLSTLSTTAGATLATSLGIGASSLTEYAGIMGRVATTGTLLTNIDAFGLPTRTVCPFANGTEFLYKMAGFTVHDMYGTVSDSFYAGYMFAVAIACFFVGYVAIVVCKIITGIVACSSPSSIRSSPSPAAQQGPSADAPAVITRRLAEFLEQQQQHIPSPRIHSWHKPSKMGTRKEMMISDLKAAGHLEKLSMPPCARSATVTCNPFTTNLASLVSLHPIFKDKLRELTADAIQGMLESLEGLKDSASSLSSLDAPHAMIPNNNTALPRQDYHSPLITFFRSASSSFKYLVTCIQLLLSLSNPFYTEIQHHSLKDSSNLPTEISYILSNLIETFGVIQVATERHVLGSTDASNQRLVLDSICAFESHLDIMSNYLRTVWETVAERKDGSKVLDRRAHQSDFVSVKASLMEVSEKLLLISSTHSETTNSRSSTWDVLLQEFINLSSDLLKGGNQFMFTHESNVEPSTYHAAEDFVVGCIKVALASQRLFKNKKPRKESAYLKDLQASIEEWKHEFQILLSLIDRTSSILSEYSSIHANQPQSSLLPLYLAELSLQDNPDHHQTNIVKPITNEQKEHGGRVLDSEHQPIPTAFDQYLPQRDQSGIVFEPDGLTVKHGTADALINNLVDFQRRDPVFRTIFFNTFPLFISPTNLLEHLSDRFGATFDVPRQIPQQMHQEYQTHTQLPSRRSILKSVLHWLRFSPAHFDVENCPNGDFEEVKKRVETVERILGAASVPEGDEAAQRLIRKLKAALHHPHHQSRMGSSTPSLRHTRQSHETQRSRTSNDSSSGSLHSPTSSRPSFSSTFSRLTARTHTPTLAESLLSIDPTHIAQQLSILDSEVYLKIHPHEFLNLHNRPGILGTIERFNFVSNLVITTVTSLPSAQSRADLVQHFIKIADISISELNNFNASHSIISALTSAPLYRLQKTWTHTPTTSMQTLERLKQLFSPNSNWTNLRACMADIPAETPATPWLGLFLRDLLSIESMHPLKLENGLINFRRCRWVSKIQSDALRFQHSYEREFVGRQSVDTSTSTNSGRGGAAYIFHPNPHIRSLLTEDRGLLRSESQQFDASLKIEPRQSNSGSVREFEVVNPKSLEERQVWADRLLDMI
ncbi:ABC transporter G member 22 [Chytridiales sp. JEL 0842]|nr:ABC transporter G member 22 [Chytridiales sp. JEL 0842]